MSKLYKIWNKRTLYEIYFRPLDDSNVEVITYFSGEKMKMMPMQKYGLLKMQERIGMHG